MKLVCSSQTCQQVNDFSEPVIKSLFIAGFYDTELQQDLLCFALGYGAEIDLVNKNGETPLHQAIAQNSLSWREGGETGIEIGD